MSADENAAIQQVLRRFSTLENERLLQELDQEMERLFQHFEQDEERTARLAAALEQESTAAALHFALFPRKTRDGGLQPTCR
eukprot:752712-Hanusia_phi.AAC.3